MERCIDTYVAEPFRGVDWQIQETTVTGTLLGTEPEWVLVAERVEAIPRGYVAIERTSRRGRPPATLPDPADGRP